MSHLLKPLLRRQFGQIGERLETSVFRSKSSDHIVQRCQQPSGRTQSYRADETGRCPALDIIVGGAPTLQQTSSDINPIQGLFGD